MDIGEGIKPGKYELFGLAVVVINVICIIIMFIILKDDLLKAILVMVLQIVVMVVSSMPFFYLQDVAERVDRLELATYNNFCNTSELAKVKSSYPSESSEELKDGCWRCTCGKINQRYVGTCACGEKRPR